MIDGLIGKHTYLLLEVLLILDLITLEVLQLQGYQIVVQALDLDLIQDHRETLQQIRWIRAQVRNTLEIILTKTLRNW